MLKLNSNIYIKNLLLAVILLLLVLPIVQQKFHFFKLKPLKGSFTSAKDSYFKKSDWLNGEYQKNQEKYTNENLGFRNLFVRVNNQIAYSFFNHARANGVIVGKDNYLFEENYIKAYYGIDFIGVDEIKIKTKKLKLIQDTLKSLNIDLIVVLASGKASFYPEKIPKNIYRTQEIDKKKTNYQFYVNEMLNNKVSFIDFNSWFIRNKSTSPHPLYPKTGIHWSVYGELLVADSIVNYIAKKRNVQMPKIQVNGLNFCDTVRGSDDDIERGMNLLFDIPDLKMAYPYFELIKDSGASYPKVLTVADSYYWGMFNWGLSRDIFNDGKFYFYNQQIYPDSYEKPLNVNEVNLKAEIEKNEVILLMSTEANLHKFAFGFVDSVYAIYYEPKEPY